MIPNAFPAPSEPSTTKDRIAAILSAKHPLSLIELQHALVARFSVSVSFQAVRKAVLSLVSEGVLAKEGRKFSFSREWILSLSKYAETLQRSYFAKGEADIGMGKDITEYRVTTLVDLDYLWNGAIKQAFADPYAPKEITFAAEHFWFLIATLAQESGLMRELAAKGVTLHYVCYGKTALDRWTVQLYRELGVQCVQASRPVTFSSGLTIGSYGDFIIQCQYPPTIFSRIDTFFSRHKTTADMPLAEISAIVTAEDSFTLQVIHNPVLASGMRKDVLARFM